MSSDFTKRYSKVNKQPVSLPEVRSSVADKVVEEVKRLRQAKKRTSREASRVHGGSTSRDASDRNQKQLHFEYDCYGNRMAKCPRRERNSRTNPDNPQGKLNDS